MRCVLVACVALAALSCSFNEGGVPSSTDAADNIDAALLADATINDGSIVDVDAAVADAAVVDANVPDANVPDANVPDANVPDADLCASCVDGLACTNDVCDPGTGECNYVDNCPGITSCNVGTQLCDGDITFVNGSGYSGTRDTRLVESSPDTSFGTDNQWAWDSQENGGGVVGLIEFRNIFSPTRIPVGATVISATLTVRVDNGSDGPDGGVFETTRSWNESETWNTFGPVAGVQPDDVGSLVAAAPSPDCVPMCGQTEAIDVTTSIGKWALNSAGMHGWIFVPDSNDGMYVASSEAGAEDRPSLRVVFTVSPPVVTP